MSTSNPAYVYATIYGIAGIILSAILGSILPLGLYNAIAGAIGAIAGVLLVSRLWPSLPVNKAHLWGAALIAYNIVLALLERIWT